MIRFGSVCSGIEAASVAWHPLGWKAAWLAEIEPFPSAVLAHHYPDVPNLGDMTTITRRVLTGEVEAPDVFTGGTPCQAFSVAGLRRSLDDARGNLSLTFCEIADAIDHVRVARGDQPAIIVWENVPGVLSTQDNAFGCFLAGLAGEDDALVPPGGKWTNAGFVHGPARSIAWRTLDAQYFGVAQRRRRVWVVASARGDFDPVQVLFEWDRVRRDSAPRREPGEDTADRAAEGAGVRRWPADVASTLNAAFGDKQGLEDQHALSGAPLFVPAQPVAFDTTQVTSAANYSNPKPGDPCHPLAAGAHAPAIAWSQDVADPLTAHEQKTYTHEGTGNFRTRNVQAVAIRTAQTGSNGWGINTEGTAYTLDSAQQAVATCVTGEVFHTLRAEGFDASEDGTGRGAGAVAVAFKAGQSEAAGGVFVTEEFAPTLQAQNNGSTAVPSVAYAIQAGALRTNPNSGPDGVGVQADHAYTLEARAEVQAVAVALRGRDGGATAEVGDDCAFTLRASTGGGDKPHVMQTVGTLDAHTKGGGFPGTDGAAAGHVQPHGMAVRRLTPRECERLQGFPDDYTAIPWRGKPASECPDGPRYKALGNSWAVPCAAWIGRRIALALKDQRVGLGVAA